MPEMAKALKDCTGDDDKDDKSTAKSKKGQGRGSNQPKNAKASPGRSRPARSQRDVAKVAARKEPMFLVAAMSLRVKMETKMKDR